MAAPTRGPRLASHSWLWLGHGRYPPAATAAWCRSAPATAAARSAACHGGEWRRERWGGASSKAWRSRGARRWLGGALQLGNGGHGHGAHGSRVEEGEGVREGEGVGRLGHLLWSSRPHGRVAGTRGVERESHGGASSLMATTHSHLRGIFSSIWWATTWPLWSQVLGIFEAYSGVGD